MFVGSNYNRSYKELICALLCSCLLHIYLFLYVNCVLEPTCSCKFWDLCFIRSGLLGICVTDKGLCSLVPETFWLLSQPEFQMTNLHFDILSKPDRVLNS